MPIRRVCRARWVPLLFALGLALGARAEQVRVAVFAPLVVGETNGVAGQAALWQSLVTTELSRQDLFAVVEREELSPAEREWVLSLAAGASGARDAGRPSWLGADLLVIGQLAVTNDLVSLSLKVLDATKGAVEKEFSRSFALKEIESSAKALASELQSLGLQQLAGRDIHTLVAVHDYDLQSPFDYNRWRERALARRLRAYLQRLPGVLVLEREDVEALLAEVRLRRAGLTRGANTETNRWSKLRHYNLITGIITETQPEGLPLNLRVRTQVRDLEGGSANEFTNTFSAEQWQEGVGRIEQQLQKTFAHRRINGITPSNGIAGRSAEAADLFARALKLTGVWEFSTPETFAQFRPSGLMEDHTLFISFGSARIPMRGVPVRRARILQAVHYLKAALLADDSDPKIKLLLASLLVDPDVNDRELSVQLAEEVGWQYPERRLTAWSHVYRYSSGDLQQRYLKLLIQYFPDSHFARLPAYAELGAFLDKHRNDPDLTAVVDAIRPFMDREIRDTRGDLIEGYVRRLFDHTQITGKNPQNRQKGYELQTAENRAKGVALLEDMIARHPDKTFFLCHFWSYYWDYYTDSDADILYWLQRAADAAPVDPKAPWNMSVWWDQPRIGLARRLMERGEFAAAIPYLEKISNGHLEGERDLRLGQCAYETGDYERALKLFRAFGPNHKEASEWAAKCEQQLGLAPLALPPKPYTTVTNRADWAQREIQFPRVKGFALKSGLNGRMEFVTNRFGRMEIPQPLGDVWAMAVDGEDVWLGLVCPLVWSDHNLLMLERDPDRKVNAMRQGGLLRFNRASGQTRFYSVTNGLPHPWVSALADSPQGLWVGTLGGGIGLLDKRTGQWRVWAETNGLPFNSVRSLCVDGDTVWAGFGHLERGAVASYSTKSDQWRVILPGDFPAQTNYPPTALLNAPGIPSHFKEPRIISYVPVSSVTAMSVIEDRLWCALPGERRGPINDRFQPRGVVVYDYRSNTWSQVSDAAPGSFAKAGDRVWMSLGGAGLAHCDLRGGDSQGITRAEGLPFEPRTITAWNGRLVIVGEGIAVLDFAKKQFVVYPFPSLGAAGLMAVEGDDLYVVRGNQLLMLKLSELMMPDSTNSR